MEEDEAEGVGLLRTHTSVNAPLQAAQSPLRRCCRCCEPIHRRWNKLSDRCYVKEPIVDRALRRMGCSRAAAVWEKRLDKRWHYRVLVVYCLLTILSLGLVIYFGWFAATTSAGAPTQTLTCSATYFDYFGCGVDALNCQVPIGSNASAWFVFRCQGGSDCLANGVDDVVGTGIYQYGSLFCPAAIHAGVIPQAGGCGLARFTGAQQFYPGSTSNGITSDEGTWFPLSIEYASVESSFCQFHQAPLEAVSLALLLPFVLLHPPGPVLWGYALFIGTWYAQFQRIRQDPVASYQGAIDNLFRVALFGGALYKIGGEVALYEPDRPWIRFFFFCIPFVLGCSMALPGYQFPDIDMDIGVFQSAAGIALLCGLSAVFLVGLVYASYIIFRERKIIVYVAGYFGAAIAIVVHAVIVRRAFQVHVHHVFIGSFFFPLTRFRHRILMLAAQGALLGVFVNGLVLWGWGTPFAPVDTPKPTGVDVPELFVLYNGTYNEAIFFAPPGVTSVLLTWQPSIGSVATSVMMNGVEVYRGRGDHFTRHGLALDSYYYFAAASLDDNVAVYGWSSLLLVYTYSGNTTTPPTSSTATPPGSFKARLPRTALALAKEGKP